MKPRKKDNSIYIIYAVVFTFLIFIALHFAMAYEWALKNPTIEIKYEGTPSEIQQEKFNISGLFNQLNKSISETPTKIETNEYTAKTVFIFGFIFIIGVAYVHTMKRKYIPGKEHGTAEWGDISQLAHLGWKNVKVKVINQEKNDLKERIKTIKKDRTTASFEKRRLIQKKEDKSKAKIGVFNETINKSSEIILAEGVKFSIFNREINSNVLTYGGSGAGKSRSLVMPNVLNLAGTCSFVITDPKGEIYQKSRYFLEKVMGYKVRCINLFEKYKSSHYNPLAYIHTDRENYDWQEDVLTLIDTMIINLDGGEGRKSPDPFWEDAPRHFIQSLFFFTMYMCEPKDRNMNQVMWLLGQLEVAEEEDNFDSPLDQLFELLKNIHGEDNIAYRTFKDFRTKATGKTATNIVMTMVSKLQPYNIASVQAISANDEMQLDKIGEEKTAIFVIVPPTSKTFNFVAGMLFSQIFQELNYSANALHGGRLPVPVQFILDEFANTCVIPNFELIIAYARSLGIGIMPILQARSQLKTMYEKQWETIEENCASTLFLGNITSEETLKAFSNRLGEGTYDEKEVSVSKGRSSSTSTSNKKIGRKLLNPDEIEHMPISDCLVFITGHKPMYCKKYQYPKHENYKYTSDFDDRYLTAFKEDHPHGEDEDNDITVKEKVINLFKEIELPDITTDPDKVVEMINETYLGNWELQPGNFPEENLIDLAEDVKLQKEEHDKQSQIIKSYSFNLEEVWKDMEKDCPVFTTDMQEVNNLINDMSDHTDELEITENYELDEDFEFMNEILDTAKNLTDEIEEVAKMQNINIDISVLSYSNGEEE